MRQLEAALQAALEGMAADFPGSFAGYTLTCDESHQSSKVDTSGTAKALAEAWNAEDDAWKSRGPVAHEFSLGTKPQAALDEADAAFTRAARARQILSNAASDHVKAAAKKLRKSLPN